jgi:hypothetical protein
VARRAQHHRVLTVVPLAMGCVAGATAHAGGATARVDAARLRAGAVTVREVEAMARADEATRVAAAVTGSREALVVMEVVRLVHVAAAEANSAGAVRHRDPAD